ncbi:MAG: LysM peptidoglycan-binding domain-containing protein [Actinobacteria bacterium]|nr:LysM peptidoglycan-binding domain-containing protein [Actinomycetota bacterium]
MAGRISRGSSWLVVLALVAAGCGGGDESTPESSAAPSEEASAPAVAESSEASEPQDSGGGDGAGEEQTYVVESGDTLSAIAQRFDTTVEAIVEANDIADPDAIDIGDEFLIPGGG